MDFTLFLILFFLIGGAAAGVFIAAAVKRVRTRLADDRSPVVTVDATVMQKQISVTHHRHPVAGDITGAHGFHTVPIRRYTVVFRTDDGGCPELEIDPAVYEQLHEGDRGRLTSQGTRFIGFDPDR